MRILVVEDEEDLLRAVCRGLKKSGYIVEGCADGAEGLRLSQENDYDLILLDLNLPTMDGLEVLRAVRERDKTQRVLILSARSAVEDCVLGLDLGANDYLPKPFHFGELEARVRSLLRRSFVQMDAVLCCGEVVLDTLRQSVTAAGVPIELTHREYAILEYLMLHPMETVSAERLIEHTGDAENALFSNAIKVHISAIRKKLMPVLGNGFIRNKRGAGYSVEEGTEDEEA